MYHFFYKIINNINGKVYYGKHSTDTINDGYMGSGVAIKRAIKKYGKENFSKQILKFFETEQEAILYEKSFITEDIVLNDKTYNLCTGGQGGASWQLWDKNSEEYKEIIKKISCKLVGVNVGKKYYDGRSKKEKNPMWGKFGEKHPLYGRKRPDVSHRLKTNSHMKYATSHPSWYPKQTYRFTFIDGKVITHTGMNDFCKKFGYQQGNLTKVLKGLRNRHRDIIKVEKL